MWSQTVNMLKASIFVLLCLVLCYGCVSHTERVPYRPHMVQQDEGVWAEVKREFGWQPSKKTKRIKKGQESLYARMARSVKGWFQDERPIGPNVHPHHWQRMHEEYDREQKRLGMY